jgi:HSP20 family protein
MKSDDIEPYDWYRKFFGRGRGGFFDDVFKGFEETQLEIEREFADIEKNMPKDLVREYKTPEGAQ